MTPIPSGNLGAAPVRTLVAASAILLALAVVAVLALRNPAVTDELSTSNPRFDQEEPELNDRPLPRIIRYVSALEGREGEACFGVVLEAKNGVPHTVLNLSALHPDVGSTFDTFAANHGFSVAEAALAQADSEPFTAFVEVLDSEHLADTILPPVDIDLQKLESGERYVVGVGFNYSLHRAETDTDHDQFLFPKLAAPTGAYTPVRLGPRGRVGDQPQLVDYEVEIAFVLLEDLDVDSPPTDRRAFENTIAYLHANDVSNRRPQIVGGDSGYTIAKSEVSYLPLGPWMVHGRHLPLRTATGGDDALRAWLRVKEAEPFGGGDWRQDFSSQEMIRGPFEIVRMAAEIYRESSRPDADGVLRHIAHLEHKVIPAGSLFLTGTGGGTAIQAPTDWDRVRLIARGNASLELAYERFANHCASNREIMGFLSPGDVVEARIQDLGRQRWRVVE